MATKSLFGESFLWHENFLLKIFSVRRRHSSRGQLKLPHSTILYIGPDTPLSLGVAGCISRLQKYFSTEKSFPHASHRRAPALRSETLHSSHEIQAILFGIEKHKGI